jgi:hypothetical protein
MSNSIYIKERDVPVCDTDIGKQGLDMLIGMDIITFGDFSVSNFNNKTVFTFRIHSKEKLDFVPQANIDNAIGTTHGKVNQNEEKAGNNLSRVC